MTSPSLCGELAEDFERRAQRAKYEAEARSRFEQNQVKPHAMHGTMVHGLLRVLPSLRSVPSVPRGNHRPYCGPGRRRQP